MIKIFRNFITLDECKKLSEIALNGVDEGWVSLGISRGNDQYKKRLTSRMHMRDKKYPKFAIEISDKIRKFMGIQYHPLILGHGSEGIVVSVTYPGGDVYRHRDPRSAGGYTTYRCNIMTQAADEGAELYVDDELVDINVGDLHCYYASEQTHYVTEVKGETPRILWMFGAHLPYENFIIDQTP
jgi:hypothetical protein